MNKNEIIKKIGIARMKANLSARALSQKIEMNDGYINRLESKKDFLPSLEVLFRIIEACDMTAEQFFYDDMHEYKTDREIIFRLKKLNSTQKAAILTILDSMK